MAGGQAVDPHIPAVGEAEHIGVSGHRGDHRFAHARTADRQVVRIVDLQLAAPVEDVVPAVVFSRRSGIVPGGAEVIGPLGHLDDGVRGDGGEKLVHGGNFHDRGVRVVRGFLAAALRTGSRAAAGHQHQRQHRGQDPGLAFFVVHDLLQSLSEIFLFGGKGGGHDSRREGGSCRHVQKGVSVALLFLPVHGAQQHLVAAELAGTADLLPDRVREGIEPVQGQHQHGKPLVQGVSSFEMHQLVHQDVLQLLIAVPPVGQDDLRRKEPEHHRRLYRPAPVQGGLSSRKPRIDENGEDIGRVQLTAEPARKTQIRREAQGKADQGSGRPEARPKPAGTQDGAETAAGRSRSRRPVGDGHRRSRRGGVPGPVSEHVHADGRNGGDRRDRLLRAAIRPDLRNSRLRRDGGRGTRQRHGAGKGQEKAQQNEQPRIVIHGRRDLFPEQFSQQQKKQGEGASAEGKNQNCPHGLFLHPEHFPQLLDIRRRKTFRAHQ